MSDFQQVSTGGGQDGLVEDRKRKNDDVDSTDESIKMQRVDENEALSVVVVTPELDASVVILPVRRVLMPSSMKPLPMKVEVHQKNLLIGCVFCAASIFFCNSSFKISSAFREASRIFNLLVFSLLKAVISN